MWEVVVVANQVCSSRETVQGIVDDQEEDIDIDVGIVSNLFSETWIVSQGKR